MDLRVFIGKDFYNIECDLLILTQNISVAFYAGKLGRAYLIRMN